MLNKLSNCENCKIYTFVDDLVDSAYPRHPSPSSVNGTKNNDFKLKELEIKCKDNMPSLAYKN